MIGARVMRRIGGAVALAAFALNGAWAADRPGDDFLKLVDAKAYASSWDVASDYFKRSVSKDEWAVQLKQVREPLGNVASRVEKSAQPQKDPPGAPAGEYLLVTYTTTFTGGPGALTETLPLIKGADGQWRVVGYFIR